MNNHCFRRLLDRLTTGWMLVVLTVVLLMPLVIGLGLVIKSLPLFDNQSASELLLSSEWRPMAGRFGFKPFILSSVYVTLIAIVLTLPVCILTALYLTQYAAKQVLKLMHPVIDILAGIPSVIFGVWGILMIVPFTSRYLAPWFGATSSGYSLLAGGLVLAVMIIPFVLNILIEVFRNIPVELSEASLSLGATRWETIKHVLLRKAFPGIVSAFGLGLSRAFGETIAVLMVVGNVVQMPRSVFDPGYPLPALIANNYGEMLSIPLYDSALMFAALLLFVIVMVFNSVSRYVIMRSERLH